MERQDEYNRATTDLVWQGPNKIVLEILTKKIGLGDIDRTDLKSLQLVVAAQNNYPNIW